MRLSLDEREQISRGLPTGEFVRFIALRLGRASPTVCQEAAANGVPERYRACDADRRTARRMHRPKPTKLAACPPAAARGGEGKLRRNNRAAGNHQSDGAIAPKWAYYAH